MKKIIVLLLAVISFASCECPYASWDDYGYGETSSGKLTYKNDYFSAEKLLGTWQMDYGCIVGTIELKEIKFLDGWNCDITMAQVRNTDWYTETWTYTYYGNTIKFARNDGRTVFSFTLRDYIFPELFLEDSFGRYTWRKVRAYGC